MKKFFLLLFTLGWVSLLSAQETNKPSKKVLRKQRINEIIKQEEEGVITYKKHTVFGGKLNTDGYGGFLEIGRAQSVRRVMLFQLEFNEKKHRKEEKQQFNFTTTAPIIYTKVNYFYPVKIGLQQQWLLGNKSNKSGVSITANLGGGFIAGLLRPYMIEVDKQGERTYVQYESSDSSDYFLNPSTYIGGPNFGTGWKYLDFVPGFYVKPAFRFDYGRYNEVVSAIEVGLTAEYYTKKIYQMVYSKQEQFFFSAYVALMFGKRK